MPDPDFLNILIIEDNPADAFLIEEMLQESSLDIGKVYSADRTSIGLKLLKEHNINLVLVDLSLPDSHGIESFLKLKEVTKKIPVIILTGLADSALAISALKMGAQDYLTKGEFNEDALVKSIQYSIERKLVGARLVASEENYRQMFYKNPHPTWIYDMVDHSIIEVNDAAIKKYGYPREEFLTLTINDIQPGEAMTEIRPAMVLIDNTDQHRKIWRHMKKNGDLIHVQLTPYEITYNGKMAIQVQVNDLTETIWLEEKLARQNTLKQKQITAAVLTAQESERKGLGEELHDNINQLLATAKLFISVAINSSSMEHVDTSMEYISLAMEEIRKLSKKLVTPAFIDGDLQKSIEELTQDIGFAKGIKFNTTIDLTDEGNLSEQIKLTIFRIIQEQLHNILKYAEASVVTLTLKQNPNNSIFICIADDGKGFDTCSISKGIGFTNMRSRVELYNGKIEIESAPGNGCTLRVKLFNNIIAKVA